MAKGLLLSGYLGGIEQQSISGLYDEMLEAMEKREPQREYVVVAVIKGHTANVVLDGDDKPPITARILAAEVLDGDAETTARRLLETARRERLGPPPPQLFGDEADREAGGEGAKDAAPDEVAEAVEAAPGFGEPAEPPTPIGKRRAKA